MIYKVKVIVENENGTELHRKEMKFDEGKAYQKDQTINIDYGFTHTNGRDDMFLKGEVSLTNPKNKGKIQ